MAPGKNPLQDAIRNIVSDMLTDSLDVLTGTVIDFDEKTYTAKVSINDSRSGGRYVREDVPVRMDKGLASYDIVAGDKVMLGFHNGDPDDPYIFMVYDEDYKNNSRENKKTPVDLPRSNGNLPIGREYENHEDKRYMENGRIGIVHPLHRSAFRIDNATGDADIVASSGLIGANSTGSSLRVKSDGKIESVAGQINNRAEEVNIATDRNRFYYNDYPLNQRMAEVTQPLGGNLRCVMARPDEILRLTAAINAIPGGQGITLQGVSPYGFKRQGSLSDMADRAQSVIDEFLPNL